MVDRTQGNDDGVDWDVLNHGVDHCRRECPGQPGCRLLLLDWPDLGERSGRLTAQRRPSDGWHSLVRTSGFQWGYFVKLWVARRLDRVLRIDLSSRCRAPIHAWPGMFRACVHSRAESTEVSPALSQRRTRHSKDICATRAACTPYGLSRRLLRWSPSGWAVLSTRLASREDLGREWFWSPWQDVQVAVISESPRSWQL